MQTNINAPSSIRNCDPKFQAAEDSTARPLSPANISL